MNGAGYGLFAAGDVRRIQFIKRAQDLGLSLREIKELMALRFEPGTSCADVRLKVEAKLNDIEQKIRDRQRMKRALVRLTTACPGRGSTSDCAILASLDSANPGP
jgi:MerR family copper efflux transcriptional regulator